VLTEIRTLRAQLKERQGKVKEQALIDALSDLDKKAAALEGSERGRGARFAPGPREPTLMRLAGDMQHLMDVLQGADAPPTTQTISGVELTRKAFAEALERWKDLKDREVNAVSDMLKKADVAPLTSPR